MLSDILTTVAIIIDSYDKSVPIYFSISNNICNEVLTDKEWVWQMLLNYLTNACKHTVDGSIHVNVSICSSTAHLSGRKMEKSGLESGMNDVKSTNPSENILFQIVDTGIGVDAKMHNCLFEVFSQAQRGQSTGTGLGLFSVYSRCKRLGGECGVVSPNESYGRGESNGSTFWFSVPYIPVSSKFMEVDDFNRYQTSHVLCSLCQPGGNVVMGIFVTEDDDEMMACPSHPSKAHTDGGDNDTADYSSFSAIIVDDMSPIRYLLKLTLEILGFAKVMTFENGERALEAMKKQLVDVVFMDVQVSFVIVNCCFPLQINNIRMSVVDACYDWIGGIFDFIMYFIIQILYYLSDSDLQYTFFVFGLIFSVFVNCVTLKRRSIDGGNA